MSIHQSDHRSDERIHDAVCDLLDDDYDVDATLIEVSVTDGEVVLLGTVPVERMRKRAETLAEKINGVHHVDNELAVSREQEHDDTETSVDPHKR